MFLHLDDTRPDDTDQIERAISLREAVAASILFHVALFLLMLWLPTLPWVQRLLARPQEAQAIPMVQQQDRAQPFVMVEPRIDREALRKLTRPVPLSDADREARSRERNPNATNNQPFMRGKSAELTEAERRRNSVGLNVVAHDGFIVARVEVPGSHRDFRFGFCGARVLSNVIRPRGH